MFILPNTFINFLIIYLQVLFLLVLAIHQIDNLIKKLHYFPIVVSTLLINELEAASVNIVVLIVVNCIPFDEQLGKCYVGLPLLRLRIDLQKVGQQVFDQGFVY